MSAKGDPDINTLLRKTLELCLELDQDRDAGLRLQELLDAIAIELKRTSGGDDSVLKPFRKLLGAYFSDLERVCNPSRGRLFGIGRPKSLFSVLPPVYKDVLTLLASSNINERTKWIERCNEQLTQVTVAIDVGQLVDTLRDGSGKQKAQAVRTLADLAVTKANHSVIMRAQVVPALIALLKGTDEQRNHAVIALSNLETEHQ